MLNEFTPIAAALAVTIPEMDNGNVRNRAAEIQDFILNIYIIFEEQKYT
jgi:hypothetical protein